MKALAALGRSRDLVEKAFVRKIHEVWVNRPWLSRLLLDFLVTCGVFNFKLFCVWLGRKWERKLLKWEWNAELVNNYEREVGDCRSWRSQDPEEVEDGDLDSGDDLQRREDVGIAKLLIGEEVQRGFASFFHFWGFWNLLLFEKFNLSF